MKPIIILSVLFFGISTTASAQLCDETPLPYFEQFEAAVSFDGLPLCSMTSFNSFASFKTFEVSPEPVEGFTGRVAQYDLSADTPGSDGFPIETSLFLGHFILEENKNYNFSFKYGHSEGTPPVMMRAILAAPEWDGFAYLITNMPQMPDETGTINQIIGVPATGAYYIRFNVSTEAAEGFVYLDDVRIEEAPTAGINDNSMTSLAIYPNPVKNVVNFSYSQAIDSVKLYNSTGQLIASAAPNSNLATLSIADLSSGVYFAHIQSGTQSKQARIIKE